MDIESVRKFCLSLPHTTEGVQWGNNLLFRIGNKIYLLMDLDAGPLCMSLKCTPEKFHELVEQEDIVPAPYLARNHWVALKTFDALPARELKDLIRNSYDLVKSKLPKKLARSLDL